MDKKRLWLGMARIVSHLTREASQAVGEAEQINLTEMTLLGQLHRLGGSSRMGALATLLQVSSPAVTKITDSLEAAGFVRRGPDPSDRRAIVISITPEGEQVKEQAVTVFERVLQEGLWDHVSDEETAAMLATLDKIQGRLGLQRGAVLPP